jgi:gliding motility-associated-like protein
LGNTSIVIKRLTTSGAIDVSFGSSGRITLPYANGFGTLKGIKILSNDKILLFINNQNPALYNLHQLTKDGVTDSSFGVNGLLTISYAGTNQQYFNQAIELPNSQLMVSGYRSGDVIISRLTPSSNLPRLTNTCTLLNSNVANASAKFKWFVNGTSIPLATTSTLSATQNGTYTVEVTDTNGCKKLSSSIILTATGPVGTSNSRCGSGPVTLSASGGANGQYRWYTVATGGTAIAGEVNSTYSPTVATTTDYFVTIPATNGCESFRTKVTATVNTGCAPVIEAIPLATQAEGKIIINLVPLITTPGILDVASIKVVAQPTSGAAASISNGVLTIDYKGKSFAGPESIVIEACNKAGVCSQQLFNITVEGQGAGGIIIYNAVSPNEDDLNPILFIKNIDSVSPKNQVSIYNRWGDQVFSISDYNNKANVFAGFSDSGSKLPTGTYFYKIVLLNGNETITGFLSIKY